MPKDRWSTYVAHRLACVRECIQDTERLMRPPHPRNSSACIRPSNGSKSRKQPFPTSSPQRLQGDATPH
jgi:hypothetical protein